MNLDGYLTDPEMGIGTVRDWPSNMRSKCRCSCVLQFTFRRAVSCVLHRPLSQVIHCTVLFFQTLSAKEHKAVKLAFKNWSHPITGVGTVKPKKQAEVLTRLESPDAVKRAPNLQPRPPISKGRPGLRQCRTRRNRQAADRQLP